MPAAGRRGRRLLERFACHIAVEPAPVAVIGPLEAHAAVADAVPGQLEFVAGQPQRMRARPQNQAPSSSEQPVLDLQAGDPFGRQVRLLVGQDREQVGAERLAEAGG